MSFIVPPGGAVRKNVEPAVAELPGCSEGRQGLRPSQPGRPPQAGVLKTLAGISAVLAMIGLALWLVVAHPFLTCLGIGAFAGIVTAIAESGAPSSSGTVPPPATPATPRERELEAQLARERERTAAAAGGGLLCGLLLGYWFFDD